MSGYSAFGVAWLVYSGLFLLVQAPIRDAVIYYQEQEEAYASAAFWLLLGLSVVAVAFVMILAGPLSEFYQLPVAAGLTLAALQDKAEEFKKLYLRLLRLLATLRTPLQVGAIVVADLAITLFFGPQWSAAIPVAGFLSTSRTTLVFTLPNAPYKSQLASSL